MKKILLLSVLSAVSFISPAQAAPDATGATVGTPSAGQAVAYRKTRPEDYKDYVRSYDLKDGKELSIFVKSNKLYASVDGQAHEIAAVAANTFVSLDGKLKVQIALNDNEADVRGEVSMFAAPEQKILAQGIQKQKAE